MVWGLSVRHWPGVVGDFRLHYAFLLAAGFSIISIAAIFAVNRGRRPASLR